MSEAGKKTLQDLGVVNDAGQPIDGGGEEWRTLQEGAGSEFCRKMGRQPDAGQRLFWLPLLQSCATSLAAFCWCVLAE
jgi:hypothetical protein